MICASIGLPAVKDNYLSGETEVRTTLLKVELLRNITRLYAGGFTTFMCGCYPGVPLWTGEAVLSLKKDFPGFEKLSLISCLPYEGFSDDLPQAFRKRCQSVIDKADSVFYSGEEFAPDCLRECDRFMSEIADCVLLTSFRNEFAGDVRDNSAHIYKPLIWLNASNFHISERFY